MSGKYRDLIKGDVAPKSALTALARKVARQGTLVADLHEGKLRAETAAAERAPEDLFVTRAELLYALDTGEAPEAWTAAPAPEGEDAP